MFPTPNFDPISGLALGLFLIQLPAFVILLKRLAKGKNRRLPLKPQLPTPDMAGTVSIVVPTLNEAKRIGPCLTALTQQTEEVGEIIIIDSNSRDNTAELVKAASRQDSRLRLMFYDPLSQGWIGPTGALQEAFFHTSPDSKWILRLDADTRPCSGLVASLLKAAENYDLVSLSTQFILKYPGELWLHPALLMTLVYRFEPHGVPASSPSRVMANGQCFLCRRSVLDKLGGFISARNSFCDDVTLARYAAQRGFKVGFLDGSKLLQVRMYEGIVETWQGWGRTIDLKDASTWSQMWLDVLFLIAIQGLPLLVTISCLWLYLYLPQFSLSLGLLWGLNLLLLLIRIAALWAIDPSIERSKAKFPWLFWLSPFADPFACLRVFISAMGRPKQWRGRKYNFAFNGKLKNSC